MMLKQTYQQDEAEQILREAARREFEAATAESRPIPHERLVAMAEELGISVETLNAVLAEKAAGTTQAEGRQRTDEALRLIAERNAFIAERREGFLWDFWSYLGVNAFLIAIHLLTQGGYFWPIWPILGWGLGLFFHALASLPTSGPTFEAAFEQWREERRRKEERKQRNRKRAEQRRAKKQTTEASAQETES